MRPHTADDGLYTARYTVHMKTYLVGGAVRDELLGYPVQERDWVVVGASPDDLLGEGFTQVGKDFPVFLHPETKEEYALARTERKQGHGYHGFTFNAAPDVTLGLRFQSHDANSLTFGDRQWDLTLGRGLFIEPTGQIIQWNRSSKSPPGEVP